MFFPPMLSISPRVVLTDALPGFRVRYDASQIVGLVDTDPVDTWEDLSANNFDLTGTSGTRPLYKTNVQNGLPVVEFDGVDDFLVSSNILFPTGNQHTLYAVLSNLSPGALYSDHDCYMDTGHGNGRRTLHSLIANPGDPGDFTDGSANYAIYFHRDTDSQFAIDVSSGEDIVFAGRFDGANSRNIVNADPARSVTYSGMTDTTASDASFRLGANFNGSGAFAPCRFCEFIVYPVAHSDTQMDMMSEWLVGKWGTV